jgi:DNA-binding winged helix-turn-helix (wHTH) protein
MPLAGEKLLALRPKAFAVLAYLVSHAHQLLTKEGLCDAAWPGAAVSLCWLWQQQGKRDEARRVLTDVYG